MMAAARTVLGDNRPARAEATQRQPSLFGAKNQTTIETMAVPAASAAFYRTSDLKTELASQGATRRQPSLVGAKKKTTIDTTAVPASPAAFYRTSDLKTETASQGATQRQPSLFGAENQTTMETMAVPAAPEALYRTSDLKTETELTSWGADELSTKNKAGPASGRDKGGPPCESLGAAADAATAQPLQGCVGPVDARRRCVLGELWAPSVALGASNLKDVKDPGFLEDHELRGTAAIVAFSIIESTVWGKLKAQQAAKMCCTLMGVRRVSACRTGKPGTRVAKLRWKAGRCSSTACSPPAPSGTTAGTSGFPCESVIEVPSPTKRPQRELQRGGRSWNSWPSSWWPSPVKEGAAGRIRTLQPVTWPSYCSTLSRSSLAFRPETSGPRWSSCSSCLKERELLPTDWSQSTGTNLYLFCNSPAPVTRQKLSRSCSGSGIFETPERAAKQFVCLILQVYFSARVRAKQCENHGKVEK
ncbi:uncharacterized protein LOC144169429 isoform X2 [Haemaphysalis longicornis]